MRPFKIDVGSDRKQIMLSNVKVICRARTCKVYKQCKTFVMFIIVMSHRNPHGTKVAVLAIGHFVLYFFLFYSS